MVARARDEEDWRQLVKEWVREDRLSKGSGELGLAIVHFA